MPQGDRRKIMENVRKNSMAPPIAVGAAAGAGGYGAPQAGGRLPTVGESPYPPQSQPRPSHSVRQKPRPSPEGTTGPQGPGPQQQQRPFQNAARYSLADPGSSPSASPRPTHPSAGGPAPHRQPSGQQQPPSGFESAPPAPASKPVKGPQTFAEMGIASTTAQKDDCIIM